MFEPIGRPKSGIRECAERRKLETGTLVMVETDQRPVPQSTLQMAAMTSDAVVVGLGKSPALLGVVVLNIAALIAAVYFLNLLISGQQQHLKALLEVQSRQQTEIVTLHKAEFDALLEMSNRLATVTQSPIAPGSQILTQPPSPPPRSR
jgi:hypothetical protein